MPEPTKSATDVQVRWTFTSFDSSSEDSLPRGGMEEAVSLPYNGTLPYDCTPIVPGPTVRHAAWPPLIIRTEKLGYIVDRNGRSYPRDIGRSSLLGKDGVVFQFGDTFAHNGAGEFSGSTSSTAAILQDPGSHPTVTSYTLDDEGKVPSFIPLRPEEQEQDLYGKRTTLWCFGGVVEVGETDGEVTAGWVFYQKGTQFHFHPQEHVFHYTGAAKIFFDHQNNKMSVRRASHPLILFKNNEPSFGTFSAVKQGENAYLFGHAPGSTKVMLARVNVRWVLDRSRYNYWDGKRYQGNIAKAKHVMDDVQHGAIYLSKLFEPNKGRDWVFVGCSRFGDSKVLMGVSANLEGPYTTVELMTAFSIIPMPKDSFAYCMYPHPWAFNEEDGELMITWSEGSMIGGVVAVKLHFAMTMDKGRPTNSMEGSIERRRGLCVIT